MICNTIARPRVKAGVNGNFMLESFRPKSPAMSVYVNNNHGNSNLLPVTPATTIVASMTSSGGIPSRALFPQQEYSNASSREASPSSCSDYPSPSDSPHIGPDGDHAGIRRNSGKYSDRP